MNIIQRLSRFLNIRINTSSVSFVLLIKQLIKSRIFLATRGLVRLRPAAVLIFALYQRSVLHFCPNSNHLVRCRRRYSSSRLCNWDPVESSVSQTVHRDDTLLISRGMPGLNRINLRATVAAIAACRCC